MADIKSALRRLRAAPASATKLSALGDARDVAFAAYRGMSDKVQDAHDERRYLRVDLREAESHRVEAEIERIQRAIQEASDEVARVEALRATAERKLQILHAVVDGTCRWLIDLPETARVSDCAARGKPPRPANWQTAFDGARAAVLELRAEMAAVENGPLPVDEAKARARTAVAELIAAGRPDVSALFSPHSESPLIRWSKEHSFLTGPAGGAYLDQVAVLPLLAWVAGEKTLTARLEREIEAAAPDADERIPGEARPRMLANLAKKLLGAEREEEGTIIAAATEAGMEFPRRADADPRATLGIEITEADASSVAA